MLLDSPFFGQLALRLELVEDPSRPTAWTDGSRLGYCPEFAAQLTMPQLIGLVAHEVMHCAMGHPWRRGGREHSRWNEAADRVINPILRDSGFELPPGGVFEYRPGHKGKATEWVYEHLPQKPPASKWCWGVVVDAGGNPIGEAEWKEAMIQAAHAAASVGKLPASLQRLVGEALKPKVPWRAILRRFVQEASRVDYSWSVPNRRYAHAGLYLPSLRSPEMGPIAVGVDTSGSIDLPLLRQFVSELRAVIEEARPLRTHVYWADCKVHKSECWERDDVLGEIQPVGGGGTDFRPVFDAVTQLPEPPVCVIYLTDLAGTFPSNPPEFPVLWATPTTSAPVPVPFGEVVEISS